MSDTVSRRAFLRRASLLGLLTASGSTLLSACGGGDEPSAGEPAIDARGGVEPAGYPVVDASTCEGYDGLTETDLNVRAQFNYVDESAQDGQYCGTCQLKKAYDRDASCIGCLLFQGPVSPGGWCNSYVPLAS